MDGSGKPIFDVINLLRIQGVLVMTSKIIKN